MGVIALAAEHLSAAFPAGVGPNRGSAIHAHTNGWLIAKNGIGFSTKAHRIVIHLITSMEYFQGKVILRYWDAAFADRLPRESSQKFGTSLDQIVVSVIGFLR